MEYLRGTDLKTGIRKHGALDCKKVAQIGSQIAQALSVAHRHDIIHRDIKPQNIMVQPDGNIKVMDFGIARAKNSHLTTDNSVLGTAHYVSPEQTQGKELGPTTDIYSLGIVMYEAATGQVPFDGDDAITVALKQVKEQPKPPSQINPNVDAALESIILAHAERPSADRFRRRTSPTTCCRRPPRGRMAAVSNATALTNLGATQTVTAPLSPTDASTAAMSRINTISHPKGQTATERAKEQEAANAKKHKKRTAVLAVVGAIALIAAIVAAVTYFNSSQTESVPNLLNLTQDEAIQQIESSNGFFSKGTVKEQYSDTVAEGLVTIPDPGTTATKGTQINIVISKGAKPAATVTVPNLSGMSPSEAEAALSNVGLVAKAGDSVYSDTVEVGKVAAQSVAGGSSAKAGDTITYQLSKGPQSVDVPNVTGQSQSDATSALQAAGFEVDVQTASSDSVEKGLVISQSPTGTATKGATITITISTGSETVSVPSVVGMDKDTAQSTLANAGFKHDPQYRYDDSTPVNQVISQSPTGNAKKGATITLIISNGPQSSSTTDDGSSDTSSSTGTSSTSGTSGTSGSSTTSGN